MFLEANSRDPQTDERRQIEDTKRVNKRTEANLNYIRAR